MNASFTHFTSMIHENLVLTSRFGTVSLQHEEKNQTLLFLIKQFVQ